MANLRFPANKTEHQFWCKITIYRRDNKDLTKAVETAVSDAEFNKEANAQVSSYNDSFKDTSGITDFVTDIAGSKATTDVLGEVWLFMPTNVTVNDAHIFENTDLATLLNAAYSATQQNEVDVQNIIKQGMGFVQQYFAQNGGLGGGIAAQALIQSGNVVNPRTQMLYRGPTLRQLALNWKLMPESSEESNNIQEIIKLFRTHSYPQLNEEKTFFQFPNIFKVDFYIGDGEQSFGDLKIIKYKELYCENVSVSYNSSNNVFFEDGHPHEVDLTLNLKETEVITREDVVEGY